MMHEFVRWKTVNMVKLANSFGFVLIPAPSIPNHLSLSEIQHLSQYEIRKVYSKATYPYTDISKVYDVDWVEAYWTGGTGMQHYLVDWLEVMQELPRDPSGERFDVQYICSEIEDLVCKWVDACIHNLAGHCYWVSERHLPIELWEHIAQYAVWDAFEKSVRSNRYWTSTFWAFYIDDSMTEFETPSQLLFDSLYLLTKFMYRVSEKSFPGWVDYEELPHDIDSLIVCLENVEV